MSEAIYTQDVVDILDLFYANDGEEPDWAAIKTRLFNITDSHYKVIISLLRAFYAIYEDESAAKTVLFRLQQERDAAE
jgi:sulfur relay (sulfurtransferase) DsrC/TusE family protein